MGDEFCGIIVGRLESCDTGLTDNQHVVINPLLLCSTCAFCN